MISLLHRCWNHCWVFLLWLGVGTGSLAASPLSVDELVQIALTHNPQVRIASESLASAQLSSEKTLRNRWPTLSLSAGLTGTHADLTGAVGRGGNLWSGNTALNLSQSLYQGGVLDAAQKQSLLTLEQARYTLQRARQGVVKEVRHAWVDLLQAYAEEQEDRETLIRLREHARISNIFFKEGKVWRNDVLQAKVRIAEGEKDLIAATNDVRRKRAAINLLLDREVDAAIDVSGKLQWRSLDWRWEQARAAIDRQHPDLLSAALAQQLAELGVVTAKAAEQPTLNLSASYSRSENFSTNTATGDDLSLTLSAAWQLWDGSRTDKSIAIARSAHRKSGIQWHDKRQQILLSVQNAWLSVQEAADQVEVLQKALDNAQENYRVNTVRYQEQLGTANDLLSAQDMLSNSRKNRLSALARYLKAIDTLQYELGADALLLGAGKP